jgi:hypothetical protein
MSRLMTAILDIKLGKHFVQNYYVPAFDLIQILDNNDIYEVVNGINNNAYLYLT